MPIILVEKLAKTEHTLMSFLTLPLKDFKEFIQECINEGMNLNTCCQNHFGVLHIAMVHDCIPEENLDYLLSIPEINPLYECDHPQFWPIEKILHFGKPEIKQSIVDKITAAIDARNEKTAERYKRFIEDGIEYKKEKKLVDETLAMANEVLRQSREIGERVQDILADEPSTSKKGTSSPNP